MQAGTNDPLPNGRLLDSAKRGRTYQACLRCQKYRLPYRPCSTCATSGHYNTCANGVRKEPKYLQESLESLVHQPFAVNPRPSNMEDPILDSQEHSTSLSSADSFIAFPESPAYSSDGFFFEYENTNTTSPGLLYNTPEHIHTGIDTPYNYAECFHRLLEYVQKRMQKHEMMRVCSAIACIRPSLIALIMNLTYEDLVMSERCLQRTLLEFKTLLSFSGTPTAIWRRTGELALVGSEFSLLTGCDKDELLARNVFIYELMDAESVANYWEKFSQHAFDNTANSVIMDCVLKRKPPTPGDEVLSVHCAFCFTIKRDTFDIPMVIIGHVI